MLGGDYKQPSFYKNKKHNNNNNNNNNNNHHHHHNNNNNNNSSNNKCANTGCSCIMSKQAYDYTPGTNGAWTVPWRRPSQSVPAKKG